MMTEAKAPYPNHFERLLAISEYAAVDLRFPQYKVLTAIEAHANFHSGEAWPGIAKLSKWTKEKNFKRVRQNIAATIAAGWLMEVKKGSAGSGNAAVYRVTIPEWVNEAIKKDRKGKDGEEKGTPQVPFTEDEKGTDSDAKGYVSENKRVRFATQKGTTHVPPTYEHRENTTTNKGADGKDGGGGNFSKEEIPDDVIAVLRKVRTLRIGRHVKDAVRSHRWTAEELNALVREIYNTGRRDEGDKQRAGRFCRALMDGDKVVVPSKPAPASDDWNGKPLSEEENRDWQKTIDECNKMKALAAQRLSATASAEEAKLNKIEENNRRTDEIWRWYDKDLSAEEQEQARDFARRLDPNLGRFSQGRGYAAYAWTKAIAQVRDSGWPRAGDTQHIADLMPSVQVPA